MTEKIKKKQEPSQEIEEEISERICKKLEEGEVSVSGLDGFILKEIEDSISFSEDWQKHYSKERIKDRVKEKKYPFIPSSWSRRLFNFLLDIIFIYIIVFILLVLVENTGEGLLILVYISPFLYYLICESIWFKTPAKFITKTKVITEYGEKPNFKTVLIRTLSRFVPFEPFSFLGSGRPRGWHDNWSKTIVVDDIKEGPVIQKEKMLYCSKCGNKLDFDSKFCVKCGEKI